MDQITIHQTPGVARYSGYMVVCSLPGGGREWLGTYRKFRDFSECGYSCAPTALSLTPGRPFMTHDISDALGTGNGPSVFFDRIRLNAAIRNATNADLREPKRYRRKFRVVPVVIEVQLRERPPVGYIGEPALAFRFRELIRRRKSKASKKAFVKRNVL